MTTPSLTAGQFDALRRLDTCRVSNAIERFNTRLRNEGYSDASIRCLFPGLGTMLGYAATLKIRCSDPPIAGRHYLEHTDWWDHILAMPAPRVLAVQDIDPRAGSGAFLGEIHVSILQALDCAGAITNGAVRDLPPVEAMKFHFFAGAVSVSHAYVHVVEVGVPVEIGGLKIEPGELLQADCHGVLSIPRELAADIPAEAAKIRAQEETLITLCRSQDFTVEKLRAVVRELRGRR